MTRGPHWHTRQGINSVVRIIIVEDFDLGYWRGGTAAVNMRKLKKAADPRAVVSAAMRKAWRGYVQTSHPPRPGTVRAIYYPIELSPFVWVDDVLAPLVTPKKDT